MIVESATRSVELALKVAQHRFPELSLLRSKARPEHIFHLQAPDVIEPSFYLIDVTIADRRIRLIEVNGSNGALSSTVAWGDELRARHMAFTFHSKPRPSGPVVAALCHQEGFLHLAEFFGRAELFRSCLSPIYRAVVRSCDEKLGNEDVSIVCGSTAAMASHIERQGSGLFYRGRPITFASNANLMPELVRRGVIRRLGQAYDVDETVYHEGRTTRLVHDKGAQQDIARGTSITPLAWRLAHDRTGWIKAVRWFRSRGIPCVAKMHGGSGGSGIELVRPSMSDAECHGVLDQLLASAGKKYGAHVEDTAFPIALFEFAKADTTTVGDRPHLWDLRVMALVYPGGVDTYACVGRLCPAPFDGSWARDTWVSNLSGRDGAEAIRYLRAPAELELGDTELSRVLQGCAEWSVAAARWPDSISQHLGNAMLRQAACLM